MQRTFSEIRLTMAASLIAESNETICDIAWKVGYRNNAAFSRAFTARYGVCPRLYRRTFGRPI